MTEENILKELNEKATLALKYVEEGWSYSSACSRAKVNLMKHYEFSYTNEILARARIKSLIKTKSLGHLARFLVKVNENIPGFKVEI